MNKVQDVVQIRPPHGFAEPPADGAVPATAAAPSHSASAAEAAKSRRGRKNSGAVVPHSIAIDTGPMGESRCEFGSPLIPALSIVVRRRRIMKEPNHIIFRIYSNPICLLN